MEYNALVNHCVYKYAFKPYLNQHRDDYFQEAFIGAMKGKDTYNPTKRVKLSTHVYNHAKYSVLNYNRYHRQQYKKDTAVRHAITWTYNVASDYVPENLLNEKEMIIYDLYFSEEMTVKQICQYTNLSRSTIYAYLYSIKQKYADYLYQFDQLI